MKDKSAKVHALIAQCLNGEKSGAKIVQGVVRSFGFSQAKIDEHKDEIRALLAEMPDYFQAGKGGGMSFLNLCMDRDGQQWGEHPTMEALVALGVAAGMASYPLPREMWPMLPGGMPYVAFNTSL